MISYARWGHAHELPFTRGAVSLGVIALVLFLTVTLHEAAHACVGLALGMKLRAFVIGPFQWRIRDGRWKYLFNPAGILSFGGSTGIVPPNPNQSRWVEIAMIAAGPFSNLCAGALAICLTLSAKGSSWERFWEPLAFFATVNLVTCAVNLVPFRPEALYSDGARIYQLLSGGPWASLHRAYSTVLSSTVSSMRPRDYDIEEIKRAQAHFTRGREALMLSLFATSHYLDLDNIPEARANYANASRIYKENRLNIPADLLTTFVFNSVYLDRDSISARSFWNLYESKSPTHFGVDYWLSRSALHWIENHPLEARDAFATGNALADQLPRFGAYDFDRDRYRMLKELLDNPSAASAPGPRTEILSEVQAG
jgi:Zn-dependent protease